MVTKVIELAERCAVILCEKDNLLFTDKVESDDFIYSNQWIPLTEECTIKEKLRLGAILDAKCGGGQISHINIGGRFATRDLAWDVLNQIAKTGVIYFAFNTKISVCKHNHGFMGDTCPTCGGPAVDSYQRIVGFLTPRASYSSTRKKEFDNRKFDFYDNLRELG